MEDTIKASLLEHFSSIEDPRVAHRRRHELSDIFFITLCAVICGADNWVDVEFFGKSKEAWFKKQLGLENGIPSHDTFGRVFSLIDTEAFSECFSHWVSSLPRLLDGESIAIDGKCLRGSADKTSERSGVYMGAGLPVSAWASEYQLVLGQRKVDEKSNEITAIPKLLKSLEVSGSVVTIDAMGCQTAIAEQIVEQGGDYLLSLKGNQGNLHEDVALYFESAKTSPEVAHKTVEKGHGRIETREVRACSEIAWLRQRHEHWVGLESIVAVTIRRQLL